MSKNGNQLKKELVKALNIPAKAINIRREHCGYSESIKCTVKDLRVSVEAVKNYLDQYREIDYCEASGEILMGGNTYVSAQYEWDKSKLQNFVPKEDIRSELSRYVESTYGVKLDINDLHRLRYDYPRSFLEEAAQHVADLFNIHSDYVLRKGV